MFSFSDFLEIEVPGFHVKLILELDVVYMAQDHHGGQMSGRSAQERVILTLQVMPMATTCGTQAAYDGCNRALYRQWVVMLSGFKSDSSNCCRRCFEMAGCGKF